MIVPKHGLDFRLVLWEHPTMIVIADKKSRLYLKHLGVKNGDAWLVEQPDPEHLTMARLKKPDEPRKTRLVRDDQGVLVIRGGPSVTVEDTRAALEHFP